MYFRSLTRGIEIGANSYLLSLGGSKILLDSGLHPRHTGLEALPDFGLLEHDSLDAVLLSHAHLDHAGSLPVLLRRQPSAQLFATEPTKDLAVAMLHNSVSVMKSQREELGITEYPLFSHRDVNHLEQSFRARSIRRPFPIGREEDRITCEFFDAGHVLGSVGILIRYRGETVFYTGDVHFEDQGIVKAATFPEHPLDTIISETTRGAEERPPAYTRSGEIAALGSAISDSLARGGSVLIPVFATGKTQETLLILHDLKKRGSIPDAPMVIGGLSTKMTEIYDRHADTAHRNQRGFRILEEMSLNPAFRSRRRNRRGRKNGHDAPIPCQSGTIYVLSSGMMTEKTLSNRFAQNILPSERNAILFVGYAAPDSPAGRLQATLSGDSFRLSPDAPLLSRDCHVEKFDFSGHAPRGAMRDFIRSANPARVLLVHGDEEAAAWFGTTLKKDLPSSQITSPAPGETIALSSAATPAES